MKTALPLAVSLVAAACAHPGGPSPLLTNAVVSGPSPDGRHTVRTKIQVDFQDIASLSEGKKVEHLFQAVTFSAETTDGARSDRQAPAQVAGTVVTKKLTGDFPDRVQLDVVTFPRGFTGGTLRLRAKNVYERPDDDPAYVDLAAPGRDAQAMVEVESVRVVDDDDGKRRIEAILDRDAPAAMLAWHHLDGVVYAMQRRGARLYVRSFEAGEAKDHRVFLDATGSWLSPPYEPTAAVPEED